MSLSIEAKCDDFHFHWTIQNAYLWFILEDCQVRSSPFKCCISGTEFFFFLKFSSRSKTSVGIHLQRNRDNGPKYVKLRVSELRVWRSADETCEINDDSNIFTFQKLDSHLLQTIVYRKEDMEPRHEPCHDLRFSCSLVSETDISVSDLFQLSFDMKNLFESEKLTDFAVRTPDGETSIHRAILEARCCGLNVSSEQGFHSDDSMIYFKYCQKSEVRNLLYFLYTGVFEEEKSVTTEALIQTTRKMGITNFKRKISFLPLKLESEIKRDYLRTRFRFGLGRKKKSYTRIFNLLGIEFKFTAQTSIEGNFQNLIVTIAHSGNIPDCIYIRCVVSLSSEFGELAHEESTWEINPYHESYDTVIRLSCPKRNTIYRNQSYDTDWLSSKRHLSFSMELWHNLSVSISESKHFRLIPNILNLSEDLLKLFENSLWTDSVIVLPEGGLKVHKAILCARSSVFETMFQTNVMESGIVKLNIEDIGINIMTKLLKFIYGAKVTLEDDAAFGEVLDLIRAAEQFQLIALRNKCLRHLCENIAKYRAMKVYFVLDFFCVEDLKTVAENFIRENLDLEFIWSEIEHFESRQTSEKEICSSSCQVS